MMPAVFLSPEPANPTLGFTGTVGFRARKTWNSLDATRLVDPGAQNPPRRQQNVSRCAGPLKAVSLNVTHSSTTKQPSLPAGNPPALKDPELRR